MRPGARGGHLVTSLCAWGPGAALAMGGSTDVTCPAFAQGLRGGKMVTRWSRRRTPKSRTHDVPGAVPVPELPGAVTTMAIQVETKDSTALTDADLDEMASMGGAFGIGVLSKAKEDWVLSTRARIDGKLNGFAFSTLERIGGTPCVLLGLLSVKRTSKRESRPQGPDGRGLPPGADGLPGRGRRDGDPLRRCRTASRLCGPWRTSSPGPAIGPSARSGRGAAGWPSASAWTPPTTSRASS